MLEKVEGRSEGSRIFRLETGETIVLPVAACRDAEPGIFRARTASRTARAKSSAAAEETGYGCEERSDSEIIV